MGAIVNCLAIILGGSVGLFLKKGIPEKIGNTVVNGVALCILLIGISGALEGKNTLITIISIVIGAVIILAVTIDVVRNKMEAKARKMAAV